MSFGSSQIYQKCFIWKIFIKNTILCFLYAPRNHYVIYSLHFFKIICNKFQEETFISLAVGYCDFGISIWNLFSLLLEGVKNKSSSQKSSLWLKELNYLLNRAGTINNPLRVFGTSFLISYMIQYTADLLHYSRFQNTWKLQILCLWHFHVDLTKLI